MKKRDKYSKEKNIMVKKNCTGGENNSGEKIIGRQ
jgi:hypothetical protein